MIPCSWLRVFPEIQIDIDSIGKFIVDKIFRKKLSNNFSFYALVKLVTRVQHILICCKFGGKTTMSSINQYYVINLLQQYISWSFEASQPKFSIRGKITKRWNKRLRINYSNHSRRFGFEIFRSKLCCHRDVLSQDPVENTVVYPKYWLFRSRKSQLNQLGIISENNIVKNLVAWAT